MIRSEQEINNDILAVYDELKRRFGSNPFLIFNPSVIEEYDEKGNLIGMHMDPEQEKLLNKLEALQEEKVRSGYRGDDRGEYGGGGNGW